jgi:type IV pilus assembly protein PilF
MMALLQWRLKQYDEADRYFRRAVNASNGLPEAENNYGVFLCDRGDSAKALRLFDKVAANPLYKSPAAALENAGMCLMRKPAPLAAEKYFRDALAANPNQARSLLQMARISYDRGNALSARGFMQRFFQVSEDTAESLLLAARIERALHNRDAEASYVVRLRGKFPTSNEAQQLASEASRPSPPVSKPKP